MRRIVRRGYPPARDAGLAPHDDGGNDLPPRWAEFRWFEVIFLGRAARGAPFEDGPEDADMLVGGIPLVRLIEKYDRRCTVSNEIIAAHSLDDVGMHPDFPAAAASLRWIMLHMIEETARHAGHMDAMRELLDGQTGYF